MGFLGSGKTSLILNMARYLTGQGEEVAILVNEAGEISLDGAVFLAHGNKVKEIFSGCICCQVAGDFVEAMKDLAQMRELSYIIIEPSGIAEPGRLTGVLKKGGFPVDKAICVLDAARFDLLLKAARMIIKSGIKNAQVVLINKKDLVSEDKIGEIIEYIRGENPSAQAIPVSALAEISPTIWEGVI